MEEENKVEEKKRIFGFRSQKIWKKIIAVVYYFIGIIMVFGVVTDWTIDVSLKDTILVKVSDFFTLLIYFSPFLVLSDFSKEIRSKIPLLKDNKKGKTFLFFLILMFIIPIISNSITDSLHSEEYKEKIGIEQEQIQAEQEKIKEEKTAEEKAEEERLKKEAEQAKKEAEEKAKKEAEEKAKKEAEAKAKKEAEKAEKNFVFDKVSYEYKEFKTKTRKN